MLHNTFLMDVADVVLNRSVRLRQK